MKQTITTILALLALPAAAAYGQSARQLQVPGGPCVRDGQQVTTAKTAQDCLQQHGTWVLSMGGDRITGPLASGGDPFGASGGRTGLDTGRFPSGHVETGDAANARSDLATGHTAYPLPDQTMGTVGQPGAANGSQPAGQPDPRGGQGGYGATATGAVGGGGSSGGSAGGPTGTSGSAATGGEPGVSGSNALGAVGSAGPGGAAGGRGVPGTTGPAAGMNAGQGNVGQVKPPQGTINGPQTVNAETSDQVSSGDLPASQIQGGQPAPTSAGATGGRGSPQTFNGTGHTGDVRGQGALGGIGEAPGSGTTPGSSQGVSSGSTNPQHGAQDAPGDPQGRFGTR